MNILFSLSIALFAGLMLSRLAKIVKLPAVTAYLVAGVLIGPYALGKLGSILNFNGIGFPSMEYIEGFSIICDVALGFIAFTMGNEFRLSALKKIGKQATVIGVFQALITCVVVDIALIVLHFIIPTKFSL
jgi:Kef-type K+ transport system membrane component KefB